MTAAAKSPKKRKIAPKKDSSMEFARVLAQAAHDTKAQDILVLDLKKVGGFTDYFVIATATSDRQAQSICDRMTEAKKPLSVEGYETGHWVLVDYGSVIAHIFYEESRAFYGLEKLWGDAPRIKLMLK